MVAGLEVLVAAAVAGRADVVGAGGVRGGVAAGEGGGSVGWGVGVAVLFGDEEVAYGAEEDGVLVAGVGSRQVVWVLFLGLWGVRRRSAGFFVGVRWRWGAAVVWRCERTWRCHGWSG